MLIAEKGDYLIQGSLDELQPRRLTQSILDGFSGISESERREDSDAVCLGYGRLWES